jgi:hypothetical protein
LALRQYTPWGYTMQRPAPPTTGGDQRAKPATATFGHVALTDEERALLVALAGRCCSKCNRKGLPG